MQVLVIQTAFLGDVILTTPLFDALAAAGDLVDVVVTPAGAQALRGHPSLRQVIVYDKKGDHRGLASFVRLALRLRRMEHDIVLIPHRSFRSAILGSLARIPRRIGFDRSAAAWTLSDVVRYRTDAHEIDRNLDLLRPLGRDVPADARPTVTITAADDAAALEVLAPISRQGRPIVAIAPGSVWNTKRWPEERYTALCDRVREEGMSVVLIGGREDAELCDRIGRRGERSHVVNAAGRLSVLQSAAAIRSASVLVTNDSAPLHLASAVGTPVVAIFGATSPSFGFGPRGPRDSVVETAGLECRPCAIHGGDRCPIGTFDCMLRIHPDHVAEVVVRAARNGR